jgi:alpha-galactosidase
MPQTKLTVNKLCGIIARMLKTELLLASFSQASTSQIINASHVDLNLPLPPKKFFRHGWQSWTLTTWLDPSEPPLPLFSPQFRAKDEDPAYAFHKNHVSAWVGAVELGDDDILLLGALHLSGRVEIEDQTLKGFYEDNHKGEWFIARGKEDEVFTQYVSQLEARLGKTRYETPPRVWCSWYSLYKWINEPVVLNALERLSDLPFDVFQMDDGWQVTHGDWEPTKKFPSGMKALADHIKAAGKTAGLWIAPFMVTKLSSVYRDHPDWLLRDEYGRPVPVGLTWEGVPYALDVSHPEVLEWLNKLIRKIRAWGYDYLKVDFLYAGALPGKRYKNIPREVAFRNAMKVIREAAGEAYVLACGAPILPSIGLCDGIRVGPDVSPYWLNTPLTVWLNNLNDTSTQNAIRTSLHRLWLKPLVNIDPDVMFFRSKHNALQPEEKQLLFDLGSITNFKATSDLPQWMTGQDTSSLRKFMETEPSVRKISRYKYQINDRIVDFSPAIPAHAHRKMPVWLARNMGFLKMAKHQVLPAMRESLQNYNEALWLLYPLASTVPFFDDMLKSL